MILVSVLLYLLLEIKGGENMKKILFLSLLVLALCVPQVKADTITTDLNLVNTNLGLTGPYGDVEVSVTGNVATFTVDAYEALLGAGPNFGIQEFGFNSSIGLLSTDFALPGGWSVNLGSSNVSTWGLYYADTTGTGSNRQDPLVFTITNTNIANASQFYIQNGDGHHYVAHIADFTNATGDINSAYFSDGPSPAPEPTTMLLLGIGLVGLAGAGRKFKK